VVGPRRRPVKMRSQGCRRTREWPCLRYGRRFYVAKTLNCRYDDRVIRKRTRTMAPSLPLPALLRRPRPESRREGNRGKFTGKWGDRHGRARPGHPRDAAPRTPARLPQNSKKPPLLSISCLRQRGQQETASQGDRLDGRDKPGHDTEAVARESAPITREAAKPLKRLKTAMGSYWKKLAWVWVSRHAGLGLAPHPPGVGADPA
jgi:hypothetical protein